MKALLDTLIKKLVAWLPKNLASVIGIAEAILKAVKEILTILLTFIAPIIPGDKDEQILIMLRDIVNKCYEALSKAKDFLLQTGN